MHCDPISDEYPRDEITAEDLLRQWIDRYYPDESAEQLYGPGMVSIFWFVDGLDAGTFQRFIQRATGWKPSPLQAAATRQGCWRVCRASQDWSPMNLGLESDERGHR